MTKSLNLTYRHCSVTYNCSCTF